MTYTEVERVSLAIQADLIKHFDEDAFKKVINGKVKSVFDESVYRGEQPVYTPTINTITAQWADGNPVDVDEVILRAPWVKDKTAAKQERVLDNESAKKDPILSLLTVIKKWDFRKVCCSVPIR